MPELSAPPSAPSPEPQTNSKPWLRKAVFILSSAAVLYAMVYADVLLRARDAYQEGEKYMQWHENPALKAAALNLQYDKEKSDLDKKLAKGKIKKDEYARSLEISAFDRDRKMEESSIKYAYVWYQTAYELFSPPESRWVKLSREKAPAAKEKWKEELRAKKIPFEDYNLE